MPARIIVPLDGSTFAEDALATALSLVGDSGTLDLVSVNASAPPLAVANYDDLARDWAMRYLDGLTEKLPPGVDAECHVLVGRPADELRTFIESSEADLVVMASHGRGPVTRAWLGSVADSLVRESKLPLMLVHPQHPDEPSYQASVALRRVLVPLDGSELAESAVDSAIGTFGPDTEMTLIRVVQNPFHTASSYLPDTIRENEAADRAAAQAETELAATWGRFDGTTASIQRDVIRSDHVGKAIVEYSETHDFDAIAIATHGRGGVRRLALGSVADKVVRSARRPVLILRP
jgi:nucleotide-binding universal stress UspA family protein